MLNQVPTSPLGEGLLQELKALPSPRTTSFWRDSPLSWENYLTEAILQQKGVVLSLCDLTGNMVRPWAEAGFKCICVDVQHQDRVEGNIHFVGADVREYLPPPQKYAFVAAFPPCTHLAASGARWFPAKGIDGLSEAISIVEACRHLCEWSLAPWMIENPVGTLSSYWRKPDHTFHPYQYGGHSDGDDAYTKKTCLWCGGGFVMPPPSPIDPVLGSKMHRYSPSKNRTNLRSATPRGFAKAAMLANSKESLAKSRFLLSQVTQLRLLCDRHPPYV